jgi:hypothetical protein
VPKELEARIRARAHQIWEEEGRPEGQERAHWERARKLVAIDDQANLRPVEQNTPTQSVTSRVAAPRDRDAVPTATAARANKDVKRPSQKRRK